MQWWFLHYCTGLKSGQYRNGICEQIAGDRDEVSEESGGSDKARQS